MKPLYFLIMISALYACNPAKKATDYMRAHPEVNAPVCADQFPVKDSLIKGDTVYRTDTLETFEVLYDTVLAEPNGAVDTVRITKTKIITNTRTITDTVIRENTARVSQLNNSLVVANTLVAAKNAEIEEWKKDYSDMKASRNKFRLWFWIACGAIGMFAFMKLRKILPV